MVKIRNYNSYKQLPYNPDLRQRAAELRKYGNLCEVLLWKQLHKRKFKGMDFDRQKIIGNYIVDFYCPDCDTVIEIDGISHNEKGDYDKIRDEYLEGLGLTVIHIYAQDVLHHLNEVMVMQYDHPALRGTSYANVRWTFDRRPALAGHSIEGNDDLPDP